MDKVLRPERFDVIPSAQDAAKRWLHWLMTFENFVAAIPSAPDKEVNKLHVLINYVTSDVYQLFCEAETYEETIALLKTLYIKTSNKIFARHKLATRKQQIGETLDQYLQELKLLSKDCNFRQVSAIQHREEAIRDAFISGLLSGSIRQRLLENKTLDLQTAFDQARALDTVQKLLPHQYQRNTTRNIHMSRVLGVDYFCWVPCCAQRPNGSGFFMNAS